MSQMQGVIQQLQQQLQQASQIIQTDQVAQQAGIEKVKIQESTAIELQRMKDATQIAVAKIQVMAKGILADRELENEQTALRMEYADYERDREHEQVLAGADRAHEATMGALGAAQDQAGAEQEGERAQREGIDQRASDMADSAQQRAHEAGLASMQQAQQPAEDDNAGA
jgi:hypothetical protein